VRRLVFDRMSIRICLRHAELADRAEFLARSRASRRLHRPWVTAPSSAAEFARYLRRMQQPGHCGFVVCDARNQAIAGVINVSHIILGPLRSAFVGYYAFAGFEGRGFMREGLRAVVKYAFTRLKLHRLEANIQPGNAASIALARSCGFVKEGYSRRYLKIGGRWRDHERWVILAS
jgi:ribosomal-protein-alanine N-acetyltransferase